MSLLGLYTKFPNFDCGACFVPTCRSLSRRCAIGLNSPTDCPILEWAQPGQRLDAEKTVAGFRNQRAELRAKIVGSDYLLVHPAESINDRPIEFLDPEVACRLFALSGMFEQVSCFKGLEAMRISTARGPILLVSSGKILVSRQSKPGPEALGPLANLIWGAINQ